MNRTLVLAAALSLAACSPDFDPASKVERLRVLDVRADFPEIDPTAVAAPSSTALTALVLRGDLAPRKATVVYLACVPTPGDPAPSPCVVLTALADPVAVLAGAAQESCSAPPPPAGAAPPIAFAGIEACDDTWTCGPATLSGGTVLPSPVLALPSGYESGFAALPQGSPDRILGVQAVLLAFALDATPDELLSGPVGACPMADLAGTLQALWSSREHVLATKRVQVRGPEAPDPPNVNPGVVGILANGQPLALSVAPGDVLLAPEPAGTPQTYTKLDANGVPIETATEDWVYSWFATAGELSDLHTRVPDADTWTVKAGDVAGTAGRAVVAVVVRDLRGGTAWAVREVQVAP